MQRCPLEIPKQASAVAGGLSAGWRRPFLLICAGFDYSKPVRRRLVLIDR
jgi:hypothetical protein